MTLRVDLRLPSLSLESRRQLESALQRLATADGEVWVVSMREGREDEWLVLVTAGTEMQSPAPEWTFVAVEEGEGERICTYARTLAPPDRNPSLVAQSLDRLLRACEPRVMPLRRVGS
jgi:hypothetical protein